MNVNSGNKKVLDSAPSKNNISETPQFCSSNLQGTQYP